MPTTESISLPFVDTGAYPTRAGNHIRPWIDGEPAFRRICEAIEAATHSAWATITFMWPSFQMPNDRGSALDVLERAAHRGVDVRLICWRPDEETAEYRRNAFWGSAEHFALLADRYPHVNIRWDRAQPGYCQHQKTWLIDAGHEHATCFAGGINLNPHSVVMPGHRGEGQNHDVYVELAGPAVADVHHNFVQRWNEASERAVHDGCWGFGSRDELPFPDRIPSRRGNAQVQIQRTNHPQRYLGSRTAPGAPAFDFASGEQTNLEQYRAAIGAARHAIYLENQYLEAPEIVRAIEGALRRGVDVVALLPITPVVSARAPTPARTAFLEARARLGAHDNFTLAGIAGLGADGLRKPVYVHAKLMLVDDEWATVGSCNLHHHSLHGNSELNVAFQDSASVRAMRVELFREHLGMDTSSMAAGDALHLFREIANANRKRHDCGDPKWQGLAIRLDIAVYGSVSLFAEDS